MILIDIFIVTKKIKISMKRLEMVKEQMGENKKEFVYSIPVTPKKKGETPIYRKVECKDGLFKIPSEIKSLNDIWETSLRKFPNNLLLENITFKEADLLAKRVGSWIQNEGHKLFFLYCLNSSNWTLTDIASWMYGLVNVPLYDTLGAEAFYHILKIT